MYYNCVPRSLALVGKCIKELGSSLRYKIACACADPEADGGREQGVQTSPWKITKIKDF